MLKLFIRWGLTALGAWLGWQLGHPVGEWISAWFGGSRIFGDVLYLAIFMAALGFTIAGWLEGKVAALWRQLEESLAATPLTDMLAGISGLALGLGMAALISWPLAVLGDGMLTLRVLLFAGLAIIGWRIMYRKKDELLLLMERPAMPTSAVIEDDLGKEHKILDTSVIIDGRIADICKTGFLEGTLVIPEFVLEELQHIADSSDLLKRNRGRRGLDILNRIQKELEVKVLIYEGQFDEIGEVDSKLVKLAKVLGGIVVTNDFNLNKVCELQRVAVLNINDLANAVKPVVLPGEEIWVQVIKDGKENGQGVAYLDDGTMIVVEGGRDHIGATIEVLVTSVLQTSAGRMIFAKPKSMERSAVSS